MQDESAVRFESVGFSYEATEGEEGSNPVFSGLDLELPYGMVSFVGQNATGKSTALLLASGRLQPDSGVVTLFGRDTRELVDEEERSRLASFIYQNMEFETELPVVDLFAHVFENGFHESKDSAIVEELISVLELTEALGNRLQDLSKGEMQRSILAFSLLYGSGAFMMDEPIFALEDYQKQRALEYLKDFSHRTATPVYFSLHELELSRLYSDSVVMFYRDERDPQIGPVDEILTRGLIEDAFEYPAAMLHQRESLYRKHLLRST